MGWSKLVDLAVSHDEAAPQPFDLPAPKGPHYPYGLRITFDDATLTKLSLDCDCDIGDMIDLRAFATVVRVEKEDGRRCVTLQLEKISLENETDEKPDEGEEQD
jgi:hypothetical protein